MSTENESRPPAKAYVRDLQRAVREYRQSPNDLKSALADAGDRLRGTRPDINLGSFGWTVRSDVLEDMGVRTTRATPTQVTIDLPDADNDTDRVELYETATTVDGATATRLVGVARYPDSNGRWRVQYESGPFGSRELGNLVLHAEALGADGTVLAIDAVGLVD